MICFLWPFSYAFQIFIVSEHQTHIARRAYFNSTFQANTGEVNNTVFGAGLAFLLLSWKGWWRRTAKMRMTRERSVGLRKRKHLSSGPISMVTRHNLSQPSLLENSQVSKYVIGRYHTSFLGLSKKKARTKLYFLYRIFRPNRLFQDVLIPYL